LALSVVYCGVFWLSFAEPASIPAEVAACGDADHLALHPHYAALPLDRQVALVQAAWEAPTARLLVFDNCEDPALLRWRPARGGCHVLITSRRSAWPAEARVQLFPLARLSRRESVALLCNHCPDLAAGDPALTAIAAAVDDLPLALHLAGSYLAHTHDSTPPDAYLQCLRGAVRLDAPELHASGASPTGHHQDIVRTFALSYQQLAPEDAVDHAARQVLQRAAYFAHGKLIPRPLLRAALRDQADGGAAAAIARTIDVGLLEATGDASRPTLRLHRLVAAYLRQEHSDVEAQRTVEQAVLATMQRLNLVDDQPALLAIQGHLLCSGRLLFARGFSAPTMPIPPLRAAISAELPISAATTTRRNSCCGMG
jgi:hypothetical protein